MAELSPQIVSEQVAGASERTRHWLALLLTPGLGPLRALRLVTHFGNVSSVFSASLTELEAVGVTAGSAQAIALGKSLELAETEMNLARDVGATLVSLDDPAYPPLLKQIYDPPVVLYVRGNPAIIAEPGVAVVGTRHPTPYGLGMAERLSCDLANRGLIIFSGMARGVDSAAHRGAISAGGKTVAVWGTGIDVVYPKENKKLADNIVASGGALLSEFPVATFPAPQNFPIRNRVISGLSLGVLVVEAAEFSGTRITARLALEQSRDVYAVPGNVTNKNSWGPNTLIKQGAKLVATWEDVWDELPTHARLLLEDRLGPPPDQPATGSLFADLKLPPHEKRIFAALKLDEATHIDFLMENLQPPLSSSEVFAALFELELAGKIRQMPGKNFVRCF